jgi:hypothetical protein
MDINDDEYKYICKKCNFYSNVKASWEKHLLCSKHITGEKATRSDKKLPDKCSQCDYKPKNNINYKQHILTVHSTKEDREKEYKFYCKYCDIGSFSSQTFDTHTKTDKHKLMIKMIEQIKNELKQ